MIWYDRLCREVSDRPERLRIRCLRTADARFETNAKAAIVVVEGNAQDRCWRGRIDGFPDIHDERWSCRELTLRYVVMATGYQKTAALSLAV